MKRTSARCAIPALVAAAWSCSSSNAVITPSATADGGTYGADTSAPTTEVSPCANALKLPTARGPLGAGRPLRIALSAEALALAREATTSEGDADA